MSIIVTCPRHYEEDAISEISAILEEMDHTSLAKKSRFPGIILDDVDADPTTISRTIRDIILKEPWQIRYIQRVIPVQKWTKTDQDDIVSEAAKLASSIKNNQTYRITIEKRDSDVSGTRIISILAPLVKSKVSLEKPDRIILIEIVGEQTGLAVINSEDILSVECEKRRSLE